jgi:hypothetical protein
LMSLPSLLLLLLLRVLCLLLLPIGDFGSFLLPLAMSMNQNSRNCIVFVLTKITNQREYYGNIRKTCFFGLNKKARNKMPFGH